MAKLSSGAAITSLPLKGRVLHYSANPDPSAVLKSQIMGQSLAMSGLPTEGLNPAQMYQRHLLRLKHLQEAAGTELTNHPVEWGSPNDFIYVQSLQGRDSKDGVNQSFPALILPVAAQELSVDLSSMTVVNPSRGGPDVYSNTVVQHWGHNQPKITVSGTTFGFVGDDGALTTKGRRQTRSYKGFDAFMKLYHQNGYELQEVRKLYRIWQVNLVRLFFGIAKENVPAKSNAAQLSMTDWVGHFDSLTYSETADSPYKFNFSFTFTALTTDPRRISGHTVGEDDVWKTSLLTQANAPKATVAKQNGVPYRSDVNRTTQGTA